MNPTKPNILWICTDQQRFDTLGCMGNPFVHTPNLDALAAEGAGFENAFCNSPVCMPSRASFLTGKYPSNCGLAWNGQRLPESEAPNLLPRVLHDHGDYYTGLSGKLHIRQYRNSELSRATDERRMNDGYVEFYWSPCANPNQWSGNDYFHWLRDKGEEFTVEPHDDNRWVETMMTPATHHSSYCAQKAINFIESCKDKPFPWHFAVNMYDPHSPFDPPREMLHPYLERLQDIPLPAYKEGELDSKPTIHQQHHRESNTGAYGIYRCPEMSEYDHRLVRAAYWAMIDLIDIQVGRMVDALKRTGQYDNTMIIFTSDHGELLGDHGIYLKGFMFYDASVHVPLLISWPGRIPAGQRHDALVELVDLYPTIMQAIDQQPHGGIQGRSLFDLIDGSASTGDFRSDVYSEGHNDKVSAAMLRTRDHKIVRDHKSNEGELYDLCTDPGEHHNLWDNPDYRDLRRELTERLAARAAEAALCH